MDAALVIMQRQKQLAQQVRADVKPTWRRTTGTAPRREGVRRHTGRIRDVRYGD